MVAYNFQKRFVAPIRARTKRQTIRAERAGRSRHARPGELVQLYFGLRTRHVQLIAAPRCQTVSPVRLDFIRDEVSVSGSFQVSSRPYLNAFAVSDGFADWDDMTAFWRSAHPGVEVFSGVLIEWGLIPAEAVAEIDARAGGGADVPLP